MKDVFEHLNKIPIEIKREWGIRYEDYSFAVKICDVLLTKLARENQRVKRYRSSNQL